MVPFTREDFLRVFETYNTAVWPAQLVLYVLAFVALVWALGDRPGARRGVLAILAGLWLWMGVVYQWMFFAPINPAAWAFGGMFVLQAVLFGADAIRRQPNVRRPPGWSRTLGVAIIGYALVLYALLGQASDHAYPRSPTFGLPCPTTIFTFGVLLAMPGRPSPWLFVIPTLWAFVGSSAPFTFGIWEDLALPLVALVSVGALVARLRGVRTPTPQRDAG